MARHDALLKHFHWRFHSVPSLPALAEQLRKAASSGDATTLATLLHTAATTPIAASAAALGNRSSLQSSLTADAAVSLAPAVLPHAPAEASLKAVNLGDSKGRTALHFAATRGDPALVRLLLRHGADPSSADINGNTALHLAACTSNTAIITALLAAGCNPHARDGTRNIHMAYAQGEKCV